MKTNVAKVIDISRVNASKKVSDSNIHLSSSYVSKFLKLFAYILYASFFGLTVSLNFFVLPNRVTISLNYIELIWVFYFLGIGLISIATISWIHGRFRELWVFKYYMIHIVNALFLTIAIIFFSLTTIHNNANIVQASITYGIFAIVYIIVFAITNLIIGYLSRNSFSLMWTKTLASLGVSVVYLIIAGLLWLGAEELNRGSVVGYVCLWVAFGLIIFTFIYGCVIFIFVQLYRNQLLLDRTFLEIDSIRRNRDAGIFAIFVLAAIALAVASASKIEISLNVANFISVLIGSLIVLSTYLAIIGNVKISKIKQEKNIKNKEVIIRHKKTTPLQNMLLESVTIVMITIIGTLGVFLGQKNNTASPLILIVVAISIVVVQIFNLALDVQFPLIKNRLTTSIKIIGLIVAAAFALIISTAEEVSIIKNLSTEIRKVILILLCIMILTETMSMLIIFFVASKAIRSSDELYTKAKRERKDALKTIIIQTK